MLLGDVSFLSSVPKRDLKVIGEKDLSGDSEAHAGVVLPEQ
jgi:hypothetical protein